MATTVGGNGTLTFEMDAVARGVALVDQLVPATYSIAANGRGTMNYTLGGRPYNYVFYLDNNNEGFMLQTDTSGSVQYWQFEAQTASSFDPSTINGAFAGAGWFNPVASSPTVAAQYRFSRRQPDRGHACRSALRQLHDQRHGTRVRRPSTRTCSAATTSSST